MKFLFTVILTFFLFNYSTANNYYWVNGSGKWSEYGTHWANSSGGSVFHVQPPTPNDSVFFDANSFSPAGDTVWLDSTILNCLNFMVSSQVDTPTFMTIGTYSVIETYGSFIIQGITHWAASASVNMKSSAQGNIADVSGLGSAFTNNTPGFNFIGSGSFSLQSEIAGLSVTNGTLYTNGFDIWAVTVSISNSTIYLSTSTIVCEEWTSSGVQLYADSSVIKADEFYSFGPNSFNIVNADYIRQSTSCTFHQATTSNVSNCNNSTFDSAIIYRTFDGNNCIFGKANFNGSMIYISGNGNIFDTLLFTTPGAHIGISSSITVNDSILLDGTCGLYTEISGGTINKPGPPVNINYVMLSNITATGAIFTANNSIDGGNVNGITINSPPAIPLYWVGGTGNWNDPLHWSTSSGGSGGACMPTSVNDLYFDANSFPTLNDTVYVNTGTHLYCKTFDCSSATNNPVFAGGNSTMSVYGSLIIHNNVYWNLSATITLSSPAPGNILDLNGIHSSASTSSNGITISGTGSYSLLSDLLFGYSSGCVLSIGNGTFYTNGHNLSASEISVGGNVYLSTSTIVCEEWMSQGLNLHGDSSLITADDFSSTGPANFNVVNADRINFTSNCNFKQINSNQLYSVNSCSFNVANISSSYDGTNCTFRKAIFTGNSIYINGGTASTFDTLLISTPGAHLSISSIITVSDSLYFEGLCGSYAQLSGGGTINKPGTAVNLNYIMLNNITASGSVFTANNSIDGGNVNGIIINSPPAVPLYWVGGTGNWNDPSHWSVTSGGTGGACMPTSFNDLFFDANSFPTLNDTVYVNTGTQIYCKTFDCSGATNNPVFKGGNCTMSVYGSLIIHGNVYWNLSSTITLLSSTPLNIVDLGGIQSSASTSSQGITFSGTGSFSLQSDLLLGVSSGCNLNIGNGTFYTNGYNLSASEVSISGTTYLSTSTINCEEWMSGGSQIQADSSTIIADQFSHNGVTNFNIVNADYISFTNNCHFKLINSNHLNNMNNCTLDVANITGQFSATNCSLGKATFSGTSTAVNGTGNQFDTLIFSNPGAIISLYDSIKVIDSLEIISSAAFPTKINGPATIVYNHQFCDDFLYIQNLNSTGGSFFAGDHSIDLGGNSNWIFASCSPLFSNVWPGDANYDLVVDNNDLLYIGVAFGDTGYVRANATMNFTAQPCIDWFFQFINGTNIKKADSDGNGLIDYPDTTAISLNYGLTHPFRISHTEHFYTTGTDLILQMPGGQVTPGTTVNIPIVLGTASNIASNVYGLAFTINYDASLIQQGTMNIDFSNSWIESAGYHLNLVKDFPSSGKCDIAFTRIDGNDITGQGLIGMMNFTVSGNATGYLHFALSNIKAISHNESDIPVTAGADSMNTGITDLPASHVLIYPNPSNGNSTIYLNNNHSPYKIEIYNTQGILLSDIYTKENTFILERKSFGSGIYFVKVINEKGETSVQKIILQ